MVSGRVLHLRPGLLGYEHAGEPRQRRLEAGAGKSTLVFTSPKGSPGRTMNKTDFHMQHQDLGVDERKGQYSGFQLGKNESASGIRASHDNIQCLEAGPETDRS